jgi:ATP synthase F1 gamma subunit
LALEVHTSYKKELARLKKKSQNQEIRKTNGKTVAVLLSSNTGLYGEIVSKVFNSFNKYAQENPEVDLVIVGKTGMRMYESNGGKKNITYFELSDSFADKENITHILKFVIDYKDIIVFHGLFVDMLKQEARMQVLTGEKALEEGADVLQHREYIFEPSLQTLVAYFEQEILRSMFNHAVHESNLSKYASRMISLDRATERINDKIDESKMTYQREKHRIQSRKQNSTLASIYGRLRHA